MTVPRSPCARPRPPPPSGALPCAGGSPSRCCRSRSARRPHAPKRPIGEKPINYTADTGDVNYQTKIGTLTGNVIITQGTLTIHADKVVLKQNPDNSMSASAFGNPVTFRQKRDGVDEYFDGYAQHAEYDGTKEFLELFDRALLRRGQDEIRSNYITYNAATEMFKAEGRAGEPVRPEGRRPGGARARRVPAEVRGAAGEGGQGRAPDAAKTTAPDAGKEAPPKPAQPAARRSR